MRVTCNHPEMFDVNKAIKESLLPRTKIKQLHNEIKRDYPNDPLLYELHMIRALNGRMAKISARTRSI